MAAGRTGKRIGLASEWDGLTQLAVLGVCFAAGTLCGFLFSALAADGGELSDYLGRYFQLAAQGGELDPALLSVVWDLLRWPLAAFLLGFTALGAAGVPMLMAARGFLLSFAAASFVRLFGLPGLAASLAAFGVTALLAVPVLFVVSLDAFRQALSRLPSSLAPPMVWSQRVGALAPCAGLLILAAALQRTVMPALLEAVCARLFPI